MDLVGLAAWCERQGLGSGPISDATRLGGGSQNVMLSFSLAGRRLVLRMPPEHKRPRSDETIRRESRVLRALADTDVPHARLVAACPELEPLGSAFFVTEHVDGLSLWAELPWPDDLARQHRVGLAVADAFAALALVQVEAAGLADLSRTDGWLERQPDRWWDQLTSYADLDGLGPYRLAGADDVHTWLTGARPAQWTVGLCHGDGHLGNVLVRRDGGGVAAIVDWELASLGDPLLDLAQLLVTWPSAGGVYADRVRAPGLPGRDELVARWAERSGRSVADLPWFEVLAAYRLGVLLEGTQARARSGQAPADVGAVLHARAQALIDHARKAADVGSHG